MIKILKEPLFQFFMIGVSLFVLYTFLNTEKSYTDSRIIVDKGRINSLIAGFAGIWNRPPTDRELKNLIDDFVVEEIYYRQALAMGMDKNDVVIRRRLQQKMEFIAARKTEVYKPSEKELNGFITGNPEKYSSSPLYSFEQVYINTDNLSETEIDIRVRAVRDKLENDDRISGDATMLPRIFKMTTAYDIDRTFGQGFADKLDSLALNSWSGPIMSGYGLHMVKLSEHRPGELLPLAQIHSMVERDWIRKQEQETEKRYLENLKRDYEIVIDWPDKQPE